MTDKNKDKTFIETRVNMSVLIFVMFLILFKREIVRNRNRITVILFYYIFC